MSRINFQAGGALTGRHSHLYVERNADVKALGILTNPVAMDYMMLIEPRQQGKTSLVNHLIRHSRLSKDVVVYLDVEDLDYADERSWCEDLWSETVWQCDSLPHRHIL